MSRLTKMIMNMRIGMKLGIASALGVIIVMAMLASQIVGNMMVRKANTAANAQQTILSNLLDAKASVRGMMIGTRDVRLAANTDAMKAALAYITARLNSVNKYTDTALTLITVPENRERVEKIKKEAADYLAGTNEIAAVRSENFALMSRDGSAPSQEVAAKIAANNQKAAEIARDKTLPLAADMEKLVNQVVEVAQARAKEQLAEAEYDMLVVERIGMGLGFAAVLILLGSAVLSMFAIARPMKALTGGMLELADGNFNVVLPGLGRKDEIGDVAQAVETFKVKSAEKARAEAMEKADRDLKEAAAKAERERIATEEKAEQDRQAAAARDAALAKVMNEFDAAVGGIAKAAMAGDFSQRVPLDGKEGVIRNLAETMNVMCDNIGGVVDELVGMLGALSQGDLSQSITANYQGKFGVLKDSANTTAMTLSQTISEIKAAAAEVSNAAAEIATSTTDLSQRTEEQAAGLEETSASMEEISVTVKKNAENAQQANHLTSSTRQIADRGGAVVAEAVDAMARIEESSRKIADIIGVIDEIARQTNLLALNAAVEAARAGDAGRGFAVVASEVRSLAQRSSQAAKDIKDLITNSSGQVQEGVELVNRAGTSLREILESIKKVSDIVADIATASAEQATGLDQVNKALSQMDEVTQQNSALVEQNAATAKTLEHQSSAMDERVSAFRLAGGGGGVRAPASAPPKVQRPTAAAPVSRANPVPRGGPVGRMQAGLATALKAENEFEEF